MKYILVNPLSNNSKGEAALEKVLELVNEEVDVLKITKINLVDFVTNLDKKDEIIIVGGDGTINNFVNRLNGNIPQNNIYIYPAGTGNDFLKDVGYEGGLFLLNKYLVNLPKVTVKGKTSYFINGIGFGIDGYCCEVGDRLKAESNDDINYTSIAIKGLLFHFKKVKATIEVDGKIYNYKHVWLAPTMNGRYYGGGMKVAPNQDRLNKERTVTNVVYKSWSKLASLIVFPSIFKGKHIEKKNMVKVVTGKKIKVTFNRPTALQIDGETVLDVLSYEVEA
jgi:diacylglycerol kinase family enzyme